MTYAITATASRAEVALQVVQTAAADRTGSAATASIPAFRSPDPRTGRSFATGAADAILGLVHTQAQAHAQVTLGQGSAHAEAEAHAWSSGSGKGSTGGAAAQPADGAAKTLPTGTAVQTTVIVSVEVQTYSVTAQRPPEDGYIWWTQDATAARKFLDLAYNRLGETADTPRTSEDWHAKVGLPMLSRGTLNVIANSQRGQFTDAEKRAAKDTLRVWDSA